jgi:hypothetical protein
MKQVNHSAHTHRLVGKSERGPTLLFKTESDLSTGETSPNDGSHEVDKCNFGLRPVKIWFKSLAELAQSNRRCGVHNKCRSDCCHKVGGWLNIKSINQSLCACVCMYVYVVYVVRQNRGHTGRTRDCLLQDSSSTRRPK